jgi:enoyl-CoA hydratase
MDAEDDAAVRQILDFNVDVGEEDPQAHARRQALRFQGDRSAAMRAKPPDMTAFRAINAHNAMFGLPEVKRGLVAGSGGLLRLPRQLPYHIAMEIILTGDMLPAPRAHLYGLINVLTDPGQALAEAIKLAQRICENGPLAVQTSKSVVNQGVDFAADEMFDLQRPLIHHIFMSDDAKEGATAFAQKRKPVWQGK